MHSIVGILVPAQSRCCSHSLTGILSHFAEKQSVRSLTTRIDTNELILLLTMSEQNRRGSRILVQDLIQASDCAGDTWHDVIGPRRPPSTPMAELHKGNRSEWSAGVSAPNTQAEDPSSRRIGRRGPRRSTTPSVGVTQQTISYHFFVSLVFSLYVFERPKEY